MRRIADPAKKFMLAVALCISLLSLAAAGLDAAASDSKPVLRVLSGLVVNANGQPVIGARVYWQVADGRAPHFLRTDVQGRFHSKPVKAGLYDVRAEAEGWWSDWQHNVLIRPTAGAEVTLKLVRKTPPSTASPSAE